MFRRILIAVCTSLALSGAALAQPPSLRLQLLDGSEQIIGSEAWAALPHVQVKAPDHGGKEALYAGVRLRDVLDLAGAPSGKALRGRNLAMYVLAEASDGYRVVYTLAEVDPDFQAGVVLIADQRDGNPLGAPDGPLRIIVPGDKHQARWVRQLERISVKQAE